MYFLYISLKYTKKNYYPISVDYILIRNCTFKKVNHFIVNVFEQLLNFILNLIIAEFFSLSLSNCFPFHPFNEPNCFSLTLSLPHTQTHTLSLTLCIHLSLSLSLLRAHGGRDYCDSIAFH